MALGHLKPALVPTPSSLLPAKVPATKLVTLEDIITFWIILAPQLGTNANEPSEDIATAPALDMPVLNENVVVVLVARSTFLKVPALFWAIIANTVCACPPPVKSRPKNTTMHAAPSPIQQRNRTQAR